MAFLAARFPVIDFSNGKPRSRERKEHGAVPKNPVLLSSHLSEDGRTPV